MDDHRQHSPTTSNVVGLCCYSAINVGIESKPNTPSIVQFLDTPLSNLTMIWAIVLGAYFFVSTKVTTPFANS